MGAVGIGLEERNQRTERAGQCAALLPVSEDRDPLRPVLPAVTVEGSAGSAVLSEPSEPV